MPNHLSVIEGLWDFISFFGVIYSIRTLRKYIVSLTAASRIRSMVDRLQAIRLVRDYIRSESSRFLCHTVSFILGAQASYIVPRAYDCCPTRFEMIYGLELVLGFILINVVTVTTSFLAYRSWLTRYGIIKRERIT